MRLNGCVFSYRKRFKCMAGLREIARCAAIASRHVKYRAQFSRIPTVAFLPDALMPERLSPTNEKCHMIKIDFLLYLLPFVRGEENEMASGGVA